MPRLRFCCLGAGVWGKGHSRQSGSCSLLWEDPVLPTASWENSAWSSTHTKYYTQDDHTPQTSKTQSYIFKSCLWIVKFDCYWLSAVNFQVLPQDVLVSESGELTELGRSYIPPRVLLDALCVICSSASQWGDPAEAENLAMEILVVTHHPSIGMRMSYSPEWTCPLVNYSQIKCCCRIISLGFLE